ncbi:histidine kinase-, DNA gyrase B-, and HSP90-like ATPase family protein [Tanacetum coccineum]
MFRDKVSVLFWRLGIQCLSEVVTREVTRYGPTDSSCMISSVRWALPYARCYIYSRHPNEYSQFKLSGFKNVNSLKIVMVEKLCQKYVIKSFGIESKERLSRFLLSGIPKSDLANFLYVITSKAQSGFTEEEMESFVTNSQKLPNLPYEELQWSLASTSSPEVESTTTSKKLGKNSSWPPVHWKTTPGFDKTGLDIGEGLFERNADLIIDENQASTMPLVNLEDAQALNDQSDSVIDKGKNIVSVPPATCKNNSKEYIEVKSTSGVKKDWFEISVNEWKSAVEKGEAFSVARVVLSDGKPPKITTYRNLEKCCKSKQLQLAIHVLK